MNDDMPRPVATDDDNPYSLTIDQVAERYRAAGHPRTHRTLQRYCKSGHLTCLKKETMLGDMYVVTPESVETHLSQITQLQSATEVAADRGEPRPVATSDGAHANEISAAEEPATSDDQPRLVATDDDLSRYVAHIENENEFLRGQINVKDTQIETSNKQIAALTERVGESNKLFLGFQQLLGLRSSTKDQNAPRPSTDDDIAV